MLGIKVCSCQFCAIGADIHFTITLFGRIVIGKINQTLADLANCA